MTATSDNKAELLAVAVASGQAIKDDFHPGEKAKARLANLKLKIFLVLLKKLFCNELPE